jgi:hypothetical protein
MEFKIKEKNKNLIADYWERNSYFIGRDSQMNQSDSPEWNAHNHKHKNV